MALPIRTRPSVPLSLSHQEASISLLSLSIRRKTEWKPQWQKITKLITWTTFLSSSMKLWAMPFKATQDRQDMAESSEKTCSTGEGSGKPLHYSWFENPMNSMKRQPVKKSVQFSRSVTSDSVTPWIAAHQASLSIINSRSLHKLMSIELGMLSSHLILCCPLLLVPPMPPSIRVFPMSQLFA